MTYASVLMERASEDLNDHWEGNEFNRWSSIDLWNYLNEAERTTVFFKPTAHVVTMVYQLVAGIRQTLPDGSSAFQDPSSNTHPKGIELVKINRNMGSDGLTAGETIFPIEPKVMNQWYSGWRSAAAAATVVHIMFDENDRTKFECYPPQPSTGMGWIEVVASAVPPEIPIQGGGGGGGSGDLSSYYSDINLGDEYIPALLSYMKYCMHSVDAQSSLPARQEAINYWNQFLSLIGRKDLIEQRLPQRGAETNVG